ncbi:MAG: CCA tRNA nucleotidyltransferase [Alphaproteobacteria bacterium]|nr:CCA tRNA nucleotidyltransferase [Alphaproteobacteria bacterium]
MQPVETVTPRDWMTAPAPTAVFAALAAGGATGRFVGGCVRNLVIDRPATDFDVATDATPERVIELATAAGLKTVPTGIAHGTVTVVVGGAPVEVTTLRRDVETDGRRAVVAFTDDWAEDAARRDFTLNALYLDADGALYDPTGLGLADARAGRIRFVGDAETRIREDVLRILRFFRFFAAYGRDELDAVGLAACAALAERMPELSGERVWSELAKLLMASRAAETLLAMAEVGVARYLWDGPVDAGRAAALIELETGLSVTVEPVRRLTALIGEPDAASAVAGRLRLSRAEKHRVAWALATSSDPLPDAAARRAAIYRHGADAWIDARLIGAAETGEDGAAVAADLALAREWTPPVFPLGGGDVMALGVPPGPATGRLLRAVEDWWVDGDFTADAKACRARLALLIDDGGTAR